MKQLIFVFFTFFITSITLSQQLRSKYDRLYTKTDTPPTFPGIISNYIDSVLRGKEFPNKGRVIIEVIIDSTGASHYNYSYDHTDQRDGSVPNLKLKQLIDNMPVWTPAHQNGYIVNFILILLLDFSDGKLIQIRDKSMDEEIKYMLNSN
jgi:hypothetical protein